MFKELSLKFLLSVSVIFNREDALELGQVLRIWKNFKGLG